MKKMMRSAANVGHLASAIALIGVGSTLSAQSGANTGSVEDRASRGKEIYEAQCAACHGPALQGGVGGPALTGQGFGTRWRARSGADLYAYIKTTMPPGNANSLDARSYIDLVAHILKVNGGPGAGKPLSDDAKALASLRLADELPALPSSARFSGLPPYSPPPEDAITIAARKHHAELMANLRPVTDAFLRNPAPESWLHWRRTYDGQGYSDLAQIDTANAAQLGLAWSLALPNSSNQITPLVHDGVIFVASGGNVVAIDGATGDQIWKYVRGGGSGTLRNLAIYGDKIFLSGGPSVTALDMRTGEVVWDRAIVGPDDNIRGYGPIAVDGKIILGTGGGVQPYPGGCFIIALDAETGEEAWRFYTIARPGQPGGDTWNGAPLDQRFGGGVWLAGTYSPELDLVYFGVGQTYKIGTLLDPVPADALFTDTTLALRPSTGELVWHYQHMQGDVWDQDWAFERTIATRIINGRPRKVVMTGSKGGLFDTLDAATGEYISSYDAGLQNVVIGIDPKTGVKKINPSVMPEANVEKLVCPSAVGGRNWMATAYNAKTGVMYIPLAEACMPYTWVPGSGPFDFTVQPARLRPDSDGMIGRLQAVDMASRKTLWVQRRRAPQTSAVLATAGNVIFEGSRDRWFRASDAESGKILWQVRLDGSPSSYPITYSVDGVQYVAVVSGGGSPAATVAELAPEILTPTGNVTIWVFCVPSQSNGGRCRSDGVKPDGVL